MLVHFLLGLFLVDNLFRSLADKTLIGKLTVYSGNLTLKSLLFLGESVEFFLVVYKIVQRYIDFSSSITAETASSGTSDLLSAKVISAMLARFFRY